MDPPPPRKRVGADPNPGWTAAPWAGVPHPNLDASLGTTARATATPPPLPSRFRASEASDASDRSTDDASTSASRAVAAALEPVAWHAYFDEKVDVSADTSGKDVFRVYARRGGERRPSFGETRSNDDPPRVSRKTETVVLFAHGCAYTALSWATTIEHLAPRLDASVLLVAFDARGHGESRTSGAETDLSAERLARDVASAARAVVRRFCVSSETRASTPRAERKTPKLVFVGHSMGGAAAARAAAMVGDRPESYRDVDLRGVALVDVAEGSASSRATRATEAFLARRPTSFATPRDAVAWFVRSGLTTNLASARVSAPSQIRRDLESETLNPGRWAWILDARATAPHWRGWFEGLSRAFVRLKCAKLLVLASADRLDTELQIAQMQGKFQTVVAPGAGHAVHEDEPQKTANALAGFLERYCAPRGDGDGFAKASPV